MEVPSYVMAMLKDPLSEVTRERQKILWIGVVTTLLVQLGLLAPDPSDGRVSVFGFSLRAIDVEWLSGALMAIVLGLLALFRISLYRDQKIAAVEAELAEKAREAVLDELDASHFRDLRSMAHEASSVSDEPLEPVVTSSQWQRLAELTQRLRSVTEVSIKNERDLAELMDELFALRATGYLKRSAQNLAPRPEHNRIIEGQDRIKRLRASFDERLKELGRMKTLRDDADRLTQATTLLEVWLPTIASCLPVVVFIARWYEDVADLARHWFV